MVPSDDGKGRGLISYFTRHPTLANLVMAVMLISGLAAATQMRAQFFPDTVLSEVVVTAAWEGAGAEDVDRAIVEVLVPVLLAVDGVADVASRAREGSARIALEFEPGVDLAQAVEDVQAAVDSVDTLPEGVDPPEVTRISWRDRVTDVVITGPVGVDQLARLADELVIRLFEAGVTRTSVRGIADPETVVEVPTARLLQHDLTLEEIAAVIAAAVDTAPAGDVGSGAARVRTGSEARDARALGALVLRSAPDGTRLTLSEVATITAGASDRGRAAFIGTNPALTLTVERGSAGDAIRLQAEVERVVAAFSGRLPQGVTVDLVRAQAEQISGRLSLLLDDALVGLGIVLAMLFLSLNARTAFWVAAGIPVAMLAGLAVMYLMGVTLNMISMFALLLILGVLVDDAIVVSEHAVFRARELGESPEMAAENAAKRMALPVLGATFTMVIAFSGLVVIGGRFGDLIADIPLTVIAVLLVSLVECFLILPNHMVHALRSEAKRAWYDAPSRVSRVVFEWVRHRAMRPFARFVVWARYPVIAFWVLLLASQGAAFLRGDVQFRFFDAPERASVTGNFAMLPGAVRDDTLAMMREVQRATDAVAARLAAEHGTNPVTFAMAEVGGSLGRGLYGADGKEPDQLGGITIELIEPDERPYTTAAFVSALQDEVRPHPLLEELTFRGAFFGPGGDALSVDLYGADSATLKAAAEALKTAMRAFPEVSALEDSLAYDKEDLVLTLTPQGHALGFSVETLARALRHQLNGIEAATYPAGPRTASVAVQLPEGERAADFLDRLMMRVGPGAHVPLADIVAVEAQSGFSTIRRENGLRVVTVSGDVSGDDPERANAVMRSMTDGILPRIEADFGVAARRSGLAQQEEEFLNDALLGFLLCLTGIYLVLTWVFSSWTRPLVVMSVIPFGFVGAVWGHSVWGVPMSMFSVVGLIGMVGIIVNDSIVLVSTVDEYRERRGLHPAIVDAVADRFRPVLLTTLTTVLGFAPLLYEGSSQAVFLKPTVITLAYGLGLGMVVVLMLVPAVMAVQGDLGTWAAALRRLRRAGTRGPARRFRTLTAMAAAGGAAVYAVTLLPVLLWGALPGWLSRALALPADAPAGPVALMLFVGATGVLAAAAYAAGSIVRPAVRGQGSPGYPPPAPAPEP